MAMEKIILVDENDRETGTGEKLDVHKSGKLHRAFSIFVFNSGGEMLMQKRARGKYHSGGLWTNTCCSHPREGEKLEDAAHRRLKQEMGFDCPLKEAFSFIYRVRFENGLYEHEFDHVFVGRHEGEPVPNPEEYEGWKWAPMEELKRDVRRNPGNYTYWFRIAVERLDSGTVKKLLGMP
jgi:isopentenyl-diphosphate delta-isomerase